MESLTRADGLARLESFLPRASSYAKERNYDRGRGRHHGVSGLSPYLRYRLISEEEVSKSVLGRFSYSTVEKFLQEVAWRTYWKGWLEMRPGVWDRYVEDVSGKEVTAECHAAMEGMTGLACFDCWCRELIETGYLHNHARMWFASIWIFTLRLSWQLGADFFLRHLLDGDPASNTLSWRWVAGLHTKGKHYLARASNIEKFTQGRFHPYGQLNESAAPLVEDHVFERHALQLPEGRKPQGRIGHLLLADDLGPAPCEVASTSGWHPREACGLWPEVSSLVHRCRTSAVRDAVDRAGGRWLDGDLSGELKGWVREESLDSIMIFYPTIGPWRKVLSNTELAVPIYHFARDWDQKLWPRANAGYFKLKKKLWCN